MKETIENRIKELKKTLQQESDNLKTLTEVMNETQGKIFALRGAIGELSKLVEEGENNEKE